jgi:hypothetical protein
MGQSVPRVSTIEMSAKSFPATSVVITNLRHVSLRGIDLDCHTLILSDDPDLHEGKERRCRLDGYGVSCVWHVFNLWLMNGTYGWHPDKEQYGFEFPGNGDLLVYERKQGLTKLHLTADNRDLEINFQNITGTWTPGNQEDWFDYCQRVGKCVFDRNCAVIEALSYQRNMLIPLAMAPSVARQVLEEDGTAFRKGLAPKQ